MKLTKKEINNVKKYQEILMSVNSKLRKGQAFFNALNHLFPEVSCCVRGTKYDPFYRDEKITDCIIFISSDEED